MPADQRIAELAERQHGVVSRRQLEALGLTRHEIEHRLAIGRLHGVMRGVYAVGHPAIDRRGRMLAAVMTCGEGAVVSHRSAAALWAILASTAARIDVSVPTANGRHPRAGLRVHRSPSLRAADVTTVDGIPVTTVARTLLDIAEVVHPRSLERALDQAEVLQIFDLAAIHEVLDAHPGRVGAARLRRALGEHDVGSTVTQSELEERFLALCRRHDIPLPAVNVWVAGLLVDFYWRRHRLVVETDGLRFHGTRRGFERDRSRDAQLAAAGVNVLRFTWRQIVHEAVEVIAALRAVLR